MSLRNANLVIQAIKELRKTGKPNPTTNQIYNHLYTMRNPLQKEEIIAAMNRAKQEGLMETGHVVTSRGFAKKFYKL